MTNFRAFRRGLLGLVIAFGAFPAFAQKVTCPEGLEWVIDGYCRLLLDPRKQTQCPLRSKMTRNSVTGPLICKASGTCPDGKRPNATGWCVEMTEAEQKAWKKEEERKAKEALAKAQEKAQEKEKKAAAGH
ncbi:MAG: hypothetical protein FGM28_02410 [Limnohabitans sp.]|jgi:hypothetical protein|nr:hypothetical protein [Limnohabitans sp.]